VAARLNAPVLGARDPGFALAQPWEAAFTWRYQESDRHFRGSEEEEDRQSEHSEVINTIHVLDVTISRNVGPRWSVSLGIPYLLAERSSPIRDDEDVTIGRSISQGRGIGDVVFSGRRWMLDPATHPETNVQLGFGIKLPTGEDNVVDRRTRYSDGEYETTLQTVDQSIQPGDGGFGIVFDIGWFRRFAENRCAGYFSGTYLFNPEGTNGVYTFRRRESEAIMSVADQYLARAGISFAVSRSKNVWLGIGGRIEGVPVEDVFGPSDGFRRPGVAVSVEPSFNLTRGPNNVSISLPIAVHRNRLRSVPDKMEEGRHGDAAFADWLLLVSYSRRFGGASGAAEAAASPTCRDPDD
jgi:hypothetical protein